LDKRFTYFSADTCRSDPKFVTWIENLILDKKKVNMRLSLSISKRVKTSNTKSTNMVKMCPTGKAREIVCKIIKN
jgi:hypothetical protein